MAITWPAAVITVPLWINVGAWEGLLTGASAERGGSLTVINLTVFGVAAVAHPVSRDNASKRESIEAQ